MNQWDALWEYHEANQLLAVLNDKLKSTPSYKEYFKQKRACKNYTESLNRISAQFEKKAALIREYSQKLVDLEKRLKLESAELESMLNDEQTLAVEVKDSKKSIEALNSESRRLTQNLNALVKWCNDVQTTINDTYTNLNAATKARDAALKLHNEEKAQAAPEADRLMANIRKKRADVPADLLNKYISLRDAVSNPVAKLEGGTCGGCHISLSSSTIHNVQNIGNTMVLCEYCGRILIPSK